MGIKSTPMCSECVHRVKFISDPPGQTINVCCGDGWSDNYDGSFDLLEVSEFDASECLLFKDNS